MIRRPPRSTLFPYTTLFRSRVTRTVPHALAPAGTRDPSVVRVRGYLHVQFGPEFGQGRRDCGQLVRQDRKSTRLNSSHANISYAVFCLKKKKNKKCEVKLIY